MKDNFFKLVRSKYFLFSVVIVFLLILGIFYFSYPNRTFEIESIIANDLELDSPEYEKEVPINLIGDEIVEQREQFQIAVDNEDDVKIGLTSFNRGVRVQSGKKIPYVELTKWEGEASVMLGYDIEGGEFVVEGNKVKYKTDDKELHFYRIPATDNQERIELQGDFDEGKIRYLNFGSVDLTNLSAHYELFQHISYKGPSISLSTPSEDGYMFYGPRDASMDLKINEVNLPIRRYRTVEKSANSPVVFIKEGGVSINLHNKDILDNPDKYLEIVTESYKEVLGRYGVELRSDFHTLYYMDGLKPRIVGRFSPDGEYILSGLYLDSPTENPEFMKPVRNYLKAGSLFIGLEGVRDLNSDLDFSIGEEIVEDIARRMNLEIYEDSLDDFEESIIEDLREKLVLDDWVLYENRVDVVPRSDVEKFEVELVLNNKPDTNIFEYFIETENLVFYYQGELSEEEKDAGDFRSENIVGSYAVYHKNHNELSFGPEANKYKVGKAFHILRPKIVDANNDWVWGELNVDENLGILSIIVPQDFLDNAVYPVKVDPTFGYYDAGGSNSTIGNTLTGSWLSLPPSYFNGSNAKLYGITAYLSVGKGSSSYGYAFYRANDDFMGGVPVLLINETDRGSFSNLITGHTLWRTLFFTSPISYSGEGGLDIDYLLVAWGNNSDLKLHFDDATTWKYLAYESNYNASFPSYIGEYHFSVVGRRYSIHLDLLVGQGTPENPINITSCQSLQLMNQNLTAHYQLVQDIKCGDTINWNEGLGFEPIGNSTHSFRGVLDGQGYKISGLYMNRTGRGGLFGRLENASILNLHLVDISFYVRDGGGITHSSSGSQIINCSSSGNLFADGSGFSSGGLVGFLVNSSLESSFSSVNVNANHPSGGLIGSIFDDSTINNSYSTGNVTRLSGSETFFGGLIGVCWGNSAFVNYSYSTGAVHQSPGVIWAEGSKGFIGVEVMECNLVGNFWDINTSGQTSSAGQGVGSLEGKTTAEMKYSAEWTLGTIYTNASWDIDYPSDSWNGTTWYHDCRIDTWELPGTVCEDYPRLIWELGLLGACDCPGSGNDWNVAMSENCEITSDCNIGNGNLIFTGTGNFTCNAVINASNISSGLSAGQNVYIKSNCRINLKG